jgi:hypothetical protein
MKSYKLDWDAARKAFVVPASGQTLADLVAAALAEELREPVNL